MVPGINVATLPLHETVPSRSEVPSFRVKVEVLTEEHSISSLKVALITEFIAMPVASFSGSVEITVGGNGSQTEKNGLYTTVPSPASSL